MARREHIQEDEHVRFADTQLLAGGRWASVPVALDDGFDLGDQGCGLRGGQSYTHVAEILEAAADGERALVLRSPEDLTTEQAAAVLGVSRPTVVRLVESGKLPARMVGTHRRLSLSDVLAHREASAARRSESLDKMAREAEELGLYD